MSDKKYISLQIEEAEFSVLYVQLHECLESNMSFDKKLITEKFEIVQVILNAQFGFKSSMLYGFEKKNPYFTNKEIDLVKRVHDLNTAIFHREFTNSNISKTYTSFSEKAQIKLSNPYISLRQVENEEWENLTKKYNQLGINKSIDELKTILKDLIYQYT